MKKLFGYLLSVLTIVISLNTTDITAHASETSATKSADEVYQDFLDATAFMETDSSWNEILETQYGLINRASLKKDYLCYVDGATEEAWASMSAYEVFVYCGTYLRFAGFANEHGAMEEKYVLNTDTSLQNYENTFFALISQTGGNDKEKVVDALREIASWQMDYYRTNNSPYNFVTGKSYAEETGLELNNNTTATNEQNTDVTNEEIKELEEALGSEAVAEIREETTPDSQQEQGSFSVIILVVALVIIASIIGVVFAIKGKKSSNEK